MKNRRNQLTAILFVVALTLAPIVQAAPQPEGGPYRIVPNELPSPDGGPNRVVANPHNSANDEAIPQGEQLPLITVHSTDNVTRGKIGTFVLNMDPALMLGGMYVKFSVSGSAVAGVDYLPLGSTAYIGQSGYAVIQVQTLADPRGLSGRNAYSVVVTLEAAAGYAIGKPSSATMWIKD